MLTKYKTNGVHVRSNNLEQATQLKTDSTPLFVLVLYATPTTDTATNGLFFDALSPLDIILDKQLLIVGDFNVPSDVENTQTDGRDISLRIFSETVGLKQYNKIRNKNNRILDLIFSSGNCRMIDDTLSLVPIDSHHPHCHFKFSLDVGVQCIHDLDVDYAMVE
ncbi:hypothetical protein HHI36_015203 [Cryptolaemus montrouzieri]|uniref:Endonuclease/exonuclease/phosphatase domain-containing protein n=1 Tax=Cryptolaemus montrouzieri TaxID=559131 RepID=A0ABD2N6D3_9CUCU